MHIIKRNLGLKKEDDENVLSLLLCATRTTICLLCISRFYKKGNRTGHYYTVRLSPEGPPVYIQLLSFDANTGHVYFNRFNPATGRWSYSNAYYGDMFELTYLGVTQPPETIQPTPPPTPTPGTKPWFCYTPWGASHPLCK